MVEDHAVAALAARQLYVGESRHRHAAPAAIVAMGHHIGETAAILFGAAVIDAEILDAMAGASAAGGAETRLKA